MQESATKLRALIARILGVDRDIRPIDTEPPGPAPRTAPASPVFSLGDGPQELVASYRNRDSETA